MDSLKSKADEIARLSDVVSRGLASTTNLDDDDIFEVEFQIDSCLKALKRLKRLVPVPPGLDHVDNSKVLVADSEDILDPTPVPKSTHDPCIIPDSLEPISAASSRRVTPSPGPVDLDLDPPLPKPAQEKDSGLDDAKLDDDVVAAFLDDDDDADFENLDESNITNESDGFQKNNVIDDDEDDSTDDEVVPDDPNVDPPSDKHRQVLKQYFGHKSFRPMQWTIISGVLNEGIDQCVVMATGYGKSLCYQYASVYTSRTTVVVSPLISLMTDQVLALSMVNIPATFLGSAQQETSSEVKRKLMNGQYRIVYVTPEFLAGDGGASLLKQLDEKVGIDLVAIDEAHCVSQWGHDFRDSYQRLGFIKTILPRVPILAVTATATPAVREDICRSLNLNKPRMTCTSFDRKNLRFSVQQKVDAYVDLKSRMTLDEKGKYCFEGSTIIYCPTKKTTEEVCEIVRSLGVPCARYHAGLPLSERRKSHEDFVKDKVQVIVATVAFGMGIDKPDVRLIVHYGAPKDLESYYQETGRAGRDGQPSTCVAYYAAKDFNVNRMILSDIQNKKFLQHKTEMLQKMQNYLSSTQCRRKMILKHFDSKAKSPLFGTEDCCDNCLKKLRSKNNDNDDTEAKDDGKMRFGEVFDFGGDAKLLLDAINLFKQRYGLGAAVALLCSTSDQRAQWHKHSSLYGKGKHRTQKWWSTFGRMLISNGYLAEERIPNSFGTTVCFTSKGERWYNKSGKPVLKLEPNHELLSLEKKPKSVAPAQGASETKILPMVPCNTWLSSKQVAAQAQTVVTTRKVSDGPREQKLQVRMYQELMRLRNTLAEEQGVAPYMVASNKNLSDLAKFRPTDRPNLALIEDLPEVKQEKFGQQFVDCIAKFCEENSAEKNRGEDEVSDAPVQPRKVEVSTETLMLMPETARTSYTMMEAQGMSLQQVCQARGIKPSTVAGHMAYAIKLGIPVNIEPFGVTDAVRKLILDTIRAPPINSDISRRTPIKDALPEDVTWEQLNIVLAILERQYGITGIQSAGSAGSTGSSVTSPPAAEASKPQSAESQGDSESQTGKRKLPQWLGQSSKNTPALKKKKSSLFKR